MGLNYKSINELVDRVDVRNTDGKIDTLIGLSIDKCFIPSVANTVGTDLTKYKTICKDQFAVSLMQVSRDSKIPVACQKAFDKAIMSPAYSIFQIKDENVILPDYLDMWFKRSEFDREAAFIAVGGVRGSMPWDEFARIEVCVPPIEEQLVIVKRYKTITDRIELKKRINDNLEEQAKALFDKKMAKAENLQPIKEFGTVITGKTPPTSIIEYYGKDVPFIKTPDMHGNTYITTSSCALSKIGADSQASKYIPANTVIVACIGANAGQVALTSCMAQTNQQINAIISDYPCFLYFSIKENTIELRTLGDGSSTMLNINKTSFENFHISSLDLDELIAFEGLLREVFSVILNNLKEIDILNELKSLIIARLGC